MAGKGKGSNASQGGKGSGVVGFQPTDKSKLPGKNNIPTPSATPPAPSTPEEYPSGASKEILDAWYAKDRERREADRKAHDEWRTATYPADVRGTGLQITPFTRESNVIRETTRPDGQTVYTYPATAFEGKSALAIELSEELSRAKDELIESGLAEVDDRGVWMVNAVESSDAGYNHKKLVLKEEYDSLPPLHKFILVHANGSFGATLTGRNFYVFGDD